MLLDVENVSKSYGEAQLLDNVSFHLKLGDRLAVLGVNGCGKSTLLKVCAKAEEPDSGKVSSDPNTKISFLPQIPDYVPDYTVIEQVISGQSENTRELKEYEAKEILGKLGITDTEQKMGTLSGGQRKRVALAQCLVSEADVLILDEPTNHLDIEMIDWLENFLERFAGAVLFVSHDRYFVEHLALKTAEVSFGRMFIYDGGYSAWLDGKARREEMEAASERKRRSTLRRELIWVLQGPCARGTKSRERLERYAALKAQLPPQTDSELEEVHIISSRLGRKTIELSAVTKSFDGRTVIQPFDFTLLRDDRIGIIGLNGTGKSTLLNIISGRLEPDSGSVVQGETVKIGCFSQHGEELDGKQTAIEYVKERGEYIETDEGRLTAERLMEMFLFSGSLQYRKIEKLSGGERRRLFLLGILAQSPNVLLLDEPTNDLDIPTLQVLENYLETFPGAVISVSHDRYYLDRVCSRMFVMSEGKPVREFNGGFSACSDYLFSTDVKTSAVQEVKKEKKDDAVRAKAPSKLRFSFKEQREFETIDSDIQVLEEEIRKNGAEQEKFCSDYVKLQELEQKREKLETQLEEKMDRWVYLNDLAERIEAQK